MNATDIKKIIAEYMRIEKQGNDEHNTMIQYLKDYEGKLINGNIFRKLPENMRFVSQYGMYYIKFKDTNNEHLIGYNSDPYIKINNEGKNGIEYLDCCYGSAAIERMNWINDTMNDQAKFAKFVKLFTSIAKAWNTLAALLEEAKGKEFSSYKNPVYYNLMKSIFPERIYKAI